MASDVVASGVGLMVAAPGGPVQAEGDRVFGVTYESE
jgi:hypothetical protein